MKILLFLPLTDIQNYFDLIRIKYYDTFPKFIKYFYKYFFKEFPLNKLYWNYYYYANLASDGYDSLFFTNNVVESSNRTINKLFIGAIKNVSLFEYTINQFIDLYEYEHKQYLPPKFSVTNAINYYVKNANIKSLITFKKLFSIYEDYAKFKNTKELLDNKENIYNEENIYNKELNNANTFNHYEIDYNTDSSVDSDEEINFNYNRFELNNNNNNGGDNDDNNNNDNEGYNSGNYHKNVENNGNVKQNTNKKEKEKKNKTKNQKNNNNNIFYNILLNEKLYTKEHFDINKVINFNDIALDKDTFFKKKVFYKLF